MQTRLLKKILKEKQEAKERPSKSIDVANRKPLFSVSNFRRDKKNLRLNGVKAMQKKKAMNQVLK